MKLNFRNTFSLPSMGRQLGSMGERDMDKADLKLVRVELKQPGYVKHAQRLLFELEDEGRIELIRMAVLEKDIDGKVDIQVVPGRLEDEHGLLHAISTDFEALFAWGVGRLVGQFASQEANLNAGRGVNLDLSGEHVDLVARSLPAGSLALLVLIEKQFVNELELVLRPFITGQEFYSLYLEKVRGSNSALPGNGMIDE